MVYWSLYLLRSWLLLWLLHRNRTSLRYSRGSRRSRWSLSLSHGTRSGWSEPHTLRSRWYSRSSRHLHLMRSGRCSWRSRSGNPRTSRHALRGLLYKLRLTRLDRLSRLYGLSWLNRLAWMGLPLLLLKHGSLRMTPGHHRGLLDIYHLKPLRGLLDLRLGYWHPWGSADHRGSRYLSWYL